MEIKELIKNKGLDDQFYSIYNKVDNLIRNRYLNLIDFYMENKIGSLRDDFYLFSTPGRTELSGNHTDHNGGSTLAASVDLDTIAAVSTTSDDKIYIISEGFPAVIVDLNEIQSKPENYGKTDALVMGIVDGFRKKDLKVSGFCACTMTNVLKGSGLSSSAAIEILIATIINSLFNNNKESMIELSKISKYAENVFFGKPSGLLDQLACSIGGIVGLDFKDENNPKVRKTSYKFKSYDIVIVDTHADHADLTDAYADIVKEMKQVASFFNKDRLVDVNEEDFYKNLHTLRETLKNDRALTRALHFFEESKRAKSMFDLLDKDETAAYLREVSNSSLSSILLLQNIYAYPNLQAVSLALGYAKKILNNKGAVRVHGGGFAGTIQAYVPKKMVREFCSKMDEFLNQKSTHIIKIRLEESKMIYKKSC